MHVLSEILIIPVYSSKDTKHVVVSTLVWYRRNLIQILARFIVLFTESFVPFLSHSIPE
jgi:hypothetical protein